MEAVLGRLAPPFSTPSAHLSSRLSRPPAALGKGTAARRCSFAGGTVARGRWESLEGNGGGGRSGRAVVAGVKKKKGIKSDGEGYGPIPDESEFFYPEAVLLKKRTGQEDDADQPEFADAEEEKLFEFLNLQLESEVKLERMRHYEVVYLIHEDHFQEVNTVVEKVQDFIKEKKGKIWRFNDWGMRKLAYKIKKAKNANYILMNFEVEARHISDFKAMLDRDERIIRHLVIRRDNAITEDCPPPPEFRAGESEEEEEEEDDYGDDDDDDDDEEYDNEGDEGFGENVFIVGEEEEEVDDDAPKKEKMLGVASST
ncbi:unnamed protein product [Spirodela intermedia]|uniref:Uncharacterized protein n=1 Tax=Spirodela intermedia TaxID=51605 RepID=A0A7I8LFN8_SPIIN|nr:unnamed protein product [Spirodela intermedia]